MNTDLSVNKQDHPKVYIPPPLIYVATFFLALYFQRRIPINRSLFQQDVTKVLGVAFIFFALPFLITSLTQFFRSKNTLITVKPATSLQTTGIYNVTRNPMYLALANIYMAVTCFIGNWWNVILFPFLILIVQEYIIKREEKYLTRRFGQAYLVYKNKVRRWL